MGHTHSHARAQARGDADAPGAGEDASFWDRDAPPPPNGLDPLAGRAHAQGLAAGRSAAPPPHAVGAAAALEDLSLGSTTPVRVGGRAPASGARGRPPPAPVAPVSVCRCAHKAPCSSWMPCIVPKHHVFRVAADWHGARV